MRGIGCTCLHEVENEDENDARHGIGTTIPLFVDHNDGNDTVGSQDGDLPRPARGSLPHPRWGSGSSRLSEKTPPHMGFLTKANDRFPVLDWG